MQQWLVADAVGGTQSLGNGVERVIEAGIWHSLSTAEQSRVALLSEHASGDIGGMFLAAIVLVILGLGGVAAWHSDLRSLFPDSSSAAESTEPVSTGRETTEASITDETTGQSPSEPVQRTDQELIVHILESNEDRMKQAKIVDETGWSKSKVSMVLSEMEDDGDISKLRVGRENIISLSGSEPEAAGSPSDDE